MATVKDEEKSASVRAAPRRARKDPNEAPVFLQKTYQMIDSVCTYTEHQYRRERERGRERQG